MNPIEEELEITKFNYKVIKANYKLAIKERDKITSDYKQLEERYKKTLDLYYENVVKLSNTEKELKHAKKDYENYRYLYNCKVADLNKANRQIKEFKDKYEKLYKSYNIVVLEREDLRKKNKEVNRDFFIVSILMFINIAMVIFG